MDVPGLRNHTLQKAGIALFLVMLAFHSIGLKSFAAQSAAPPYLQVGGNVQALTCVPSPSPTLAFSDIQIVLMIDDSASMGAKGDGNDLQFNRDEGAKNLVDILLKQYYVPAIELKEINSSVELPDLQVAVIHFRTAVVGDPMWVKLTQDDWPNQQDQLSQLIDENKTYTYDRSNLEQRTDFKPPFTEAGTLFGSLAEDGNVTRAILLFTDGVPDLGKGELSGAPLQTEMNNVKKIIQENIPDDIQIYVTGLANSTTRWNEVRSSWSGIVGLSPASQSEASPLEIIVKDFSARLPVRMEEVVTSLIHVQRMEIEPLENGSGLFSYPIPVPQHVKSLRVTLYDPDSTISFSIKGPSDAILSDNGSQYIHVWEITDPLTGDYSVETSNNKGIVTALFTYQNLSVNFDKVPGDIQMGKANEIKFTVVDEFLIPVMAEDSSLSLNVSVTQNGQETLLVPTGDVYQFSWTPKIAEDEIMITANLIDAKEKNMILNCSGLIKLQVPPTYTPTSTVTSTPTATSTFTPTATPTLTALPCCVPLPPCACDVSWHFWFWPLAILLIALLVILLVLRSRPEPVVESAEDKNVDIFRTNYWHLLFWPLVALLILLILTWLWWSSFIPPWVFLILLWVSMNMLILIGINIWSHQNPVLPPLPDDLTIIEGIGPEVEKVLNEKGITTFKQLAEADPDELKKWMDEKSWTMMDPWTWRKQAELADKFIKPTGKKEDLDKFNELITTLKDGISPDEYSTPIKERKHSRQKKKPGKK